MENKLDIMQELMRQAVNEQVDDKLDQIIDFIESLKSEKHTKTYKRTPRKQKVRYEDSKPTLLIGRTTLVPPQEKIPVKR